MSARHALAALLLLIGGVLGGAGCKENPAATAKCDTEPDGDACEACCKANGANGYKFINGDCACLGG